MTTATALATATATSRVEVLGCPVDPLDMEATLDRCEAIIQARDYAQHMAVNVAKLVACRENPLLREAVENSAIINADGQGVVWAARLLGTPLPERVAGIDLMDALMGRAADRGWRVFVLGARDEVLDRAADVLRDRHPGLTLAGMRNGYFKPDEVEGVVEQIRAAEPDILFVAMGTPHKELFLAEYGPSLGVPLVMGVGGAIDVVAGVTRRAPMLFQRLGLEWFYRLMQEPRRMFRRYAVTNARFASLLLRALGARLFRGARAFG
jgi:N-acetylglucosaminyldiphosphoundecaprenol N-acetyl-beta-D-mannosaminyltransferase